MLNRSFVPSFYIERRKERFSIHLHQKQSERPSAAKSNSAPVVLSEPPRPRPEEGPRLRCLFITWNDGHPPSQITVPPDYTLERHGLRRRRRPAKFTVFSDDAQTELYIDTRLVRSAYLLTIGADQRILNLDAA